MTETERNAGNSFICALNAADEIYQKLPHWNLARNTLTRYFEDNPENDSKEVVLTKFTLINSLYWTQIHNIVEFAESASGKVSKLCEKLNQGDPEVVFAISENRYFSKKKERVRHEISFASKFCHFHNKDKYPIYDKFVCKALRLLGCCTTHRLPNYTKNTIHTYPNFLNKLEDFKTRYKVPKETSLEEMDTFLWLYGMTLCLDEKENIDINKEVLELYKKNKKLFDRLTLGTNLTEL